MNENINEVNKEEKVEIKKYMTPRFIIVTAVAAGTGLYMVGRSIGFKGGYEFGHLVGQAGGYEKGVTDVGKIVNEIKNNLSGE